MTDPTPVPVPPLVSGEELLVAADIIEPSPAVVEAAKALDPRTLAVFESFNGFDLSALTTASRLAMAAGAVKAVDATTMRLAKMLHPSSPGWDGFDPGADVEPEDDGSATDPHALWSDYDHPAGDTRRRHWPIPMHSEEVAGPDDYYSTPGAAASEDRQRHMSGGDQ